MPSLVVRRGLAAGALASAALIATASPASAIPSFARQTRLPCSACHTQFPELTEMGRNFKLNGYVLRSIDAVEVADSLGHQQLLLNLPSILSMMFQASATTTAKAIPGAKNFSVFLPDQLSLFLAGEIGPKLGAFVQVTMDPQSGTLGIDNTELRYATQASLFRHSATVGLSLNNNPAISDLWNTTPVWGFPFASSAIAPTPAATTAIDGALAQKVAGLTAFAYIQNRVYLEFGGYRASPVGARQPLTTDSSVTGVVQGVAPYWRAAYTRGWGNNLLMVGTYGLAERQYPGGGAPLTGLTDGFLDLAADAQYMRLMGDNSLTVAATWIYEKQHLDATHAANGSEFDSHSLNTVRGRVTYHVGQRYGFTLAPFFIIGERDSLLYAPGSVSGSASGKPNSSGLIAEADFMPWQNVRLSAQYTMYGKFNGGTTNYDGTGRRASWNNTLYLSMWLMY